MNDNNNSLQSLFSCLLKKEASYCLHTFYCILFFTIATQGVLVACSQTKEAFCVGGVAFLVLVAFALLTAKRLCDYLKRASFQGFDMSQNAVLVPSFLQIRRSIRIWAYALIACFIFICTPCVGSIFAFFFISSLQALFALPKEKIRPFLQNCSLITSALGAALFTLAFTTSYFGWYVILCALASFSAPPILIEKKVADPDSKGFLNLAKLYSKGFATFGIILFLFLFAPFGDQNKEVFVNCCAFFFLFFCPFAILTYRSVSMKKSIKSFADKTASTISRDCITGKVGGDVYGQRTDLSDLSDCVRESDGYYRVCMPQYFNENPQKEGECGYLASPEEDRTTFPTSDGSWVIFRNLSSVANFLHFRQDEIGASCRNTLSALVNSLLNDVYNDSDKSYFDNLLSPWITRVWDGRSTKDYLKTPWESGEVLGVPITKQFLFQYPLGCGVVDKDTIPCGGKLTAQISLRQELVDAVRHISSLNPEECKKLNKSDPDVKLLRNFLVRYNLIVPSVYEAFFIQFLEKIKTLHCFQPNEEERKDVDGIFQKTFSEATDFSELLPKEIAELVSVSVRDASTTQLIVTDQKFNVFAKLEFWEKEKDVKYFEQMKKLDQIFTNLILKGATEGGEDDNALQKMLDNEFNAILQATQTGGDLIAKAIGSRGNQNTPTAMKILQERLNEFAVMIRIQQGECKTRLSKMTEILKSSSVGAP